MVFFPRWFVFAVFCFFRIQPNWMQSLGKSQKDKVPLVCMSPAEKSSFPLHWWVAWGSWSAFWAEWDYAWNQQLRKNLFSSFRWHQAEFCAINNFGAMIFWIFFIFLHFLRFPKKQEIELVEVYLIFEMSQAIFVNPGSTVSLSSQLWTLWEALSFSPFIALWSICLSKWKSGKTSDLDARV